MTQLAACFSSVAFLLPHLYLCAWLHYQSLPFVGANELDPLNWCCGFLKCILKKCWLRLLLIFPDELFLI